MSCAGLVCAKCVSRLRKQKKTKQKKLPPHSRAIFPLLPLRVTECYGAWGMEVPLVSCWFGHQNGGAEWLESKFRPLRALSHPVQSDTLGLGGLSVRHLSLRPSCLG